MVSLLAAEPAAHWRLAARSVAGKVVGRPGWADGAAAVIPFRKAGLRDPAIVMMWPLLLQSLRAVLTLPGTELTRPRPYDIV